MVTLKDCDLPTLVTCGGGVDGSGGGGLSGGDWREFLLGVENMRDCMKPPGLPDLNLLPYTGSSDERPLTPGEETGGGGVKVALEECTFAGGLVGGVP